VIWALGEIDTRQARNLRNDLFDDLGRRESKNDQVWSGELPQRYPRDGYGHARGAGVPHALTELLGDLQSRDALARQEAAFGLGLLGVTGALDSLDPVEPLLDLLQDPAPEVRAMAIWSLDEINPSRWGGTRHAAGLHRDHDHDHDEHDDHDHDEHNHGDGH